MGAQRSEAGERSDRSRREVVARAAFDGWPHGFVVLDAALERVVDFNRRFEELFALEREEAGQLRGAPLDLLRRGCARALLDPAHFDALLLRDGEPLRLALRNGVGLEGSSHALEGSAELGRLLVFEDASARLRREEQSREVERRKREVERLESLGSVAGGIAHEFNNLLTGILGSAEFVLEQLPAGDSRRRPVERVLAAGLRAATLCEELITSAGFGAFEVRRVHLSDLANRTLRRLQPNSLNRVRVEQRLAPELPLVGADEGQIARVFENVFFNATDAVAPDGGLVRVSTGSQHMASGDLAALAFAGGLPEGEYAWFEIEDDGAGMDEATRARMFDPFFSTKFPGRGLGLSSAARIVRSHRGAIEVESHVGRGTRVRVLLPVSV